MTPTAILPQSPLSLHRRTLTLGCPVLDRLLAGGIPTGAITELVAESGAGKTQLCLQLLLSSLLPASRGGLASSSIYFHTELFPFPLRRLHSLSLSFTDLPPSPLDQILVRAIHSAEELLAVLDRLDPVLLHPPAPSSLPVGLIVIDSIAALFRADFDNNLGDLKRRSALFFQIAGKLKELAWRHGAAVVVTNQVVDVIGEAGGSGVRVGNYQQLWSSGRSVCAALGMAWANCVNVRVFLSRWEESAEEVDERSGVAVVTTRTKRRLQVVFAPHLPEGSCEFEIGKGGVACVQEGKGGLI